MRGAPGTTPGPRYTQRVVHAWIMIELFQAGFVFAKQVIRTPPPTPGGTEAGREEEKKSDDVAKSVRQLDAKSPATRVVSSRVMMLSSSPGYATSPLLVIGTWRSYVAGGTSFRYRLGQLSHRCHFSSAPAVGGAPATCSALPSQSAYKGITLHTQHVVPYPTTNTNSKLGFCIQ